MEVGIIIGSYKLILLFFVVLKEEITNSSFCSDSQDVEQHSKSAKILSNCIDNIGYN